MANRYDLLIRWRPCKSEAPESERGMWELRENRSMPLNLKFLRRKQVR